MMTLDNEFRKKLELYKEGKLSQAEEEELEQDLEKFEVYQDFLDEEFEPDMEEQGLSEEKKLKLINLGRRKAVIKAALLGSVLLLSILPAGTLLTYIFYGYGEEQNMANRFLDVASDTVMVTEPNVQVDRNKFHEQVGLFTLSANLDMWKQVGTEQTRIGDKGLNLWFSNLENVDHNYLSDSFSSSQKVKDLKIHHPNVSPFPSSEKEWQRLSQLPEGTVAEAYVSFDKLYDPNDVENLLGNIDHKTLWYAIDTGYEKEQKDKNGVVVTPIGYPVQNGIENPKKMTTEEFHQILKELTENEGWSEKIAKSRDLHLKERLAYVNKNGIKTYGIVMTGPTKEILKLKDNKHVKGLELGEVELWQWE
jgi:hypothetical protein